MNRRWTAMGWARLVVLGLWMGALAPRPAWAAGEPWAVVVGIDRYQDPTLQPLQFAVSDAREVADRLVQLGFAPDHVLLLENQAAKRERVLQLLGDDLPRRMAPEDSLLVYWSGHGLTETLATGAQQGYLMSWDASPARPYATAIPMKAIRELAERSPARHILYLLDACYSGLAVPGMRAHLEWTLGGGYAQLEKYDRLPSRHILTAGQAGERVLETEGHGLFTHHLLRALDGQADGDGDGILAATELAAWMRARVTEASAMAQTPQYARWYGEGEYTFVVGPLSETATSQLDGAYRAVDPGAEPAGRATLEAPPRWRGPALTLAGVGAAALGGALYAVGAERCAELGATPCDDTLRPLMGATVGLWGGGVAGVALGLGLTFGGGAGVGLAPWSPRRTEPSLTASVPGAPP